MNTITTEQEWIIPSTPDEIREAMKATSSDHYYDNGIDYIAWNSFMKELSVIEIKQ